MSGVFLEVVRLDGLRLTTINWIAVDVVMEKLRVGMVVLSIVVAGGAKKF